jgi:hypothetical protein
MTQQEETTPDFVPIVASLPPLESSIRTFIGSDASGPIYTRLEYEPVTNQAQIHAPNVIKGLIRRLEETHPDYVERLTAAITDRVEDKASGPTETSQKRRPPTDYDLQLQQELAQANTVHDFAGQIIMKSMFNQQTKQLSEQKIRNRVELAKNVYAEDPLVGLSQEAAAIFRRDEFDHLARFTVSAAVAVVEYSGIYDEEEAKAHSPKDTNSAA